MTLRLDGNRPCPTPPCDRGTSPRRTHRCVRSRRLGNGLHQTWVSLRTPGNLSLGPYRETWRILAHMVRRGRENSVKPTRYTVVRCFSSTVSLLRYLSPRSPPLPSNPPSAPSPSPTSW